MKPSYYNDIFSKTAHYQGPPEKSPYYTLWVTALASIPRHSQILDAGCGPGQFGELCTIAGHRYLGVDYSTKAIALAKEKGYGDYEWVDLEEDLTLVKAGGYDVFTALEFLEHIGRDREVVASIPAGRCVVISGPDYLTEEHLRCFTSLQQLRDRYSGIRWIRGWVLSGVNTRGESVNIYMAKGMRV